MIPEHQYTLKKKNRKLLIGILSTVGFMFVFGFLMIPLYNVMAKMDGINGKYMTPTGKINCGTLDITRVIHVQLSTSLHANLAFYFVPKVKQIDLHPGEIEQAIFIAKNNTGHDLQVQCTGSVAPGVASRYFEAVQNICARPQLFAKNQTIQLPMQFYINSTMPKYINLLTLNITLADAERKILQRPKLLNGKYKI